MIVRDWSGVETRVLEPLYEQERRHWRAEFSWDSTDIWNTIEQARHTWALPGALAYDQSERVTGWMFYVLDGQVLTIGGLVAASTESTAALVDATLETSQARQVAITACFVPDRAPDVLSVLRSRGFATERYLYLSKPLSPALACATHADRWRAGDAQRSVPLLQMAYPGDAGCHFAPHGELAEWRRYVTDLVEQTGCGALEPEMTRVVRRNDRIDALALVTRIAPETLHLAQVAVHPDLQGHGLARGLLADVSVRGAAGGFTTVTLLVGEHNRRARRLYEALGFTPRGVFVAARRGSQGPSDNK